SAGPMLHFMHVNMIAVFAHAPWLLAAIHVALTESDARRVAGARLGVALLTASELLLGFPQSAWFCTLLELLYVAYLAHPSSARALLGLAVAKALGVLAAAAQLLPTLDVLARSNRAAVAPGFPYTFALHPLELVQLVAPYVFEERETTNEYA